jgi:hypothetical protein
MQNTWSVIRLNDRIKNLTTKIYVFFPLCAFGAFVVKILFLSFSPIKVLALGLFGILGFAFRGSGGGRAGGGSGGFFGGGSGNGLFLRVLHQGHDLIGGGYEPYPLGKGYIPDMDGLVHPKVRYVNFNPLGQIFGETFHFDFVEGKFQNAPFPDACGIPLEMYGNPGPQENAAFDLVKINMEDVSVGDIPLGIFYKGVISLSVYFHLDNGTFGNMLNPAGKFLGVQINGNGLA